MKTDSLPTDPEVAQVQERLLRMLESVRLERAEAPANDPAPQQPDCPHCGSNSSWESASWCPDCGYYPKLGRVVAPEERDAVEQEELAARRQAGRWVARLVAGILVILIVSCTAAWKLRGSPWQGSWALAQLLFGLSVFCLGHVQAYLIAAQHSDEITLASLLVNPVKLWQAACRRLPVTNRVLYEGSWGLTASFLAVAVIGLDYDGLLGGRKTSGGVNPIQAILQLATGMTSQAQAVSQGAGEDPEATPAAAVPAALPTPVVTGSSSNQSMEGAIAEFAGQSGAENLVDSAAQGSGEFASDPSQSLSVNSLPADPVALAVESDTPAPGEPATTQATPSTANDPAASAPVAEKQATDPPAAKVSVMDSAGTPTKPADISAAKPSEPAPAPRTPDGRIREDHGEFVIFGYLVNAAGEMRSVLLAEIVNGRGTYACKLPLDELPDSKLQQLQATLDEVRTAQPALPSPYRARWVRPVVTCRVAYLGRTPEGWLKQGYLVSFDLSEPLSRTGRPDHHPTAGESRNSPRR